MSTLALYRRYRPQTFSDITGQHHIKITLQNELATSKVSHAYLFTGPRGVGKTSMARILAKAVNCERRVEGAAEPCNECKACEEIRAGRAFDVIEIDAASNTGVDNVRENIIENVRFGPSLLKTKVFIIDEVHMLSASAFNALLKTLEEPPAHAIFILATTELHKVPPTIVSRCQRFDFKRIGQEDMLSRLAHLAVGEKREIEPAVLGAVARAGGGSLRDAESLLGQIFAVTDGAIGEDEASILLPRSDIGLALRFLEAALRRNPGPALEVVAVIADEGVDPLRFLDDCILALRRMLLVKLEHGTGPLAGEFNAETEKQIAALAEESSLPRLTSGIELLLGKRLQVKDLDAGLLPLELAAVELSFDPAAAAPAPSPNPFRPAGGASSKASSPDPAPAEKKSEVKTEKDEPSAPAPAKSNAAPPRAVNRDCKITLDQVRGSWSEFIRNVGEVNHSLPFILNVSAPVRVENGVLVIGSRYPFHCERLNTVKHQTILAEACEKFFGESMGVLAEVSETAPAEMPGDVAPLTTPTESDPALAAILDALGGKVVG